PHRYRRARTAGAAPQREHCAGAARHRARRAGIESAEGTAGRALPGGERGIAGHVLRLFRSAGRAHTPDRAGKGLGAPGVSHPDPHRVRADLHGRGNCVASRTRIVELPVDCAVPPDDCAASVPEFRSPAPVVFLQRQLVPQAVNDGPYTPPRSHVDDPPKAARGPRPRAVKIALALLWIGVAAALATWAKL